MTHLIPLDNGAAKCRDIVECNIMSVLDVTRAVLPGMLERKAGAVLNISSFLAYGGPLLSVYAASKAFVMQLSEDLNREYRDQGDQSSSVSSSLIMIILRGECDLCCSLLRGE